MMVQKILQFLERYSPYSFLSVIVMFAAFGFLIGMILPIPADESRLHYALSWAVVLEYLTGIPLLFIMLGLGMIKKTQEFLSRDKNSGA